jgi:hypothetical protein
MPVIVNAAAPSGGGGGSTGPSTPRGLAPTVPATSALRFAVPDDDFCAYLKGFWKRNLEWRQFGASFKHLRATNNVVCIEEDLDAVRQPNTQYGPSYLKSCICIWPEGSDEAVKGSSSGRLAGRTRNRISSAPTRSRSAATQLSGDWEGDWRLSDGVRVVYSRRAGDVYGVEF